jgi:hypothetical protein
MDLHSIDPRELGQNSFTASPFWGTKVGQRGLFCKCALLWEKKVHNPIPEFCHHRWIKLLQWEQFLLLFFLMGSMTQDHFSGYVSDIELLWFCVWVVSNELDCMSLWTRMESCSCMRIWTSGQLWVVMSFFSRRCSFWGPTLQSKRRDRGWQCGDWLSE